MSLVANCFWQIKVGGVVVVVVVAEGKRKVADLVDSVFRISEAFAFWEGGGGGEGGCIRNQSERVRKG